MKFSRTTITAGLLVPLTIGTALAAYGTTAASAAVRPPARHVATGSMELANPLQYEQFQALQGFGRNHGYVEYTNWTALASTYGETGSGAYAPEAAPITLTFNGAYAHTLNGAGLKLTALSNDRLAFKGTGYYNASTLDTWTIQGQVRGGQLDAVIRYGGLGARLPGGPEGARRLRRVGDRHGRGLEQGGPHVHHGRRVLPRGAALHRADPG